MKFSSASNARSPVLKSSSLYFISSTPRSRSTKWYINHHSFDYHTIQSFRITLKDTSFHISIDHKGFVTLQPKLLSLSPRQSEVIKFFRKLPLQKEEGVEIMITLLIPILCIGIG